MNKQKIMDNPFTSVVKAKTTLPASINVNDIDKPIEKSHFDITTSLKPFDFKKGMAEVQYNGTSRIFTDKRLARQHIAIKKILLEIPISMIEEINKECRGVSTNTALLVLIRYGLGGLKEKGLMLNVDVDQSFAGKG